MPPGAPPPGADPAAMATPPPGAPPPGAPPPPTPEEKKDLPVDGVKLINAIDLMDPDRILRYIKTTQSGIVNTQNDEPSINDELAGDNIQPKPDTNKKLLTSKDIINRYLYLRRIAAAAADVIRTLSSERIQNAQIENSPNMPDLTAEAKPTPAPVAAPQGTPPV